MRPRKIAALALIVALLGSVVSANAQSPSAVGFQSLFDVEAILYGAPGDGPILPRLERVERDVYGRVQDGEVLIVRIERLAHLFSSNLSSGASLLLTLNAIEWMIFQQVTHGQSVSRRLEALEASIYGQTRTGSINERLEHLTQQLWPGGRINVATHTIPNETVVRISLLREINSSSMRVGDTVPYRVTDTVILENNVVIPAGAEGVGRVVEVRQAGRGGREGLVTVEWGELRAIDGSLVKVTVGERASERNQSLELATGAAIAGVVLLGPLGLAAGALVSGRDHVVPTGTQFYAEVAREARVSALSLVRNPR